MTAYSPKVQIKPNPIWVHHPRSACRPGSTRSRAGTVKTPKSLWGRTATVLNTIEMELAAACSRSIMVDVDDDQQRRGSPDSFSMMGKMTLWCGRERENSPVGGKGEGLELKEKECGVGEKTYIIE